MNDMRDAERIRDLEIQVGDLMLKRDQLQQDLGISADRYRKCQERADALAADLHQIGAIEAGLREKVLRVQNALMEETKKSQRLQSECNSLRNEILKATKGDA